MGKLTVKVIYDYYRDIELTLRVQEDVVDKLNEAIFNVLNQAMTVYSVEDENQDSTNKKGGE